MKRSDRRAMLNLPKKKPPGAFAWAVHSVSVSVLTKSSQPRTDQVEFFAQTAPMFPEGLTLSCQN